MNRIQILPGLILQLLEKRLDGGVPKNCRVSIPRWDANPPSPGDKSVAHHDLQKVIPRGAAEVPHPPAGVDPDGRMYHTGIRKKFTPVLTKKPAATCIPVYC